MPRFLRPALIALLAASAMPALAQTAAGVLGLEAGEHAVGFRLLEDQDASRVVTGGVRGVAQPRPIRTYLWYPAATGRRAQPLTFGRYAALADDDIWPEALAGDARARLQYANGPLARALSPESFAALLARPMHAAENAEPLAGPFPLIVIGLGLYYESPITFATTAEYLAGRGFVVATAPLVGTDVAIVRLVVPDLETQIRDLEFVIGRARQLKFVDPARLGVMGFDQGGMAGLVLAMRNRDVDAFVSLDSGIQYPHPSGLPRSSPHYDPRALRIPWLHAVGRGDGPLPTGNPRSLFDEAVYAERYWLRIQDLGHADFTSYALVEGRGEVAGYWSAVTPAQAATHRLVAEYIRHFFAAHLSASEVSLSLFDEALRQELPAGMRLEFRAAARAPIDYDEAVSQLIEGRGDEVVAALRRLAADAPEHPMLSEFNLGRLCFSLLYTWNLAQETLPLAELAAERYPSSPNAIAMLGETQAMLGNYAAAIAAYEQLEALIPGNSAVAVRLESLRSQR